MAIVDDFSVAVNGDIRYTGTTVNYTVLELHRFLQDLADNASSSGDDLVDITSSTPSDRSTDNIITLLDTYNIDDNAAEHLFDGSITQDGGNTVYSGLRVLGAVNDPSTQLMIIQDSSLYQYTTIPTTPFWDSQFSGGYNGNATAGILMRCLIKTRLNGADIDGQKARVQARHWGDTYDFFNVTLGQGESVAAIGTTPDPQNTTTQSSVNAYTHISNTEGYQLIDLNNGAGTKPYYSLWTFGADTSGDGLKGLWEYVKDLTGNGTSTLNYNINGELFLGITHSVSYTGETSGPFLENETIVWGTEITYDGLSGNFNHGDYITIGSNGAAGKIVYDNGTTDMIVALENTTITLLNNDIITKVSTGTAASALINITITNNNKSGGEALLLGLNDTGTSGTIYIQLLTGSAPAAIPFRGRLSNAIATSTSTSSKTVPKIFMGSYTGTLIGAYGIGVLPANLTASDTIEDLNGTTQTPPNNITFTVTGLVSGEDRILVGPRSGIGQLQKDQDTLAVVLNAPVINDVSVNSVIPSDTPESGTIRIELDTSIYRWQSYSSYSNSTYVIDPCDYSGAFTASAGNNIFISYIDKLAAASSESFTSIYLASRDLFIRDRDGGITPIKTFEAPATLGSGGGTIAVIRTSDA